MGFFSRLFGGSQKSAEVKTVEPVEYKGYLIYQESISEGGQYRIAGRIEKAFEGEVKSHRFIRSDLLGSEQDANELMLKKSQMFIDQMGEKIFD
ncbi:MULTISPECIES: HlyU family transcriptional regulator [Vibrio]|uniref:Transcriptional activator HlyU n=1 Tax=Vibrio rotiferianus TaxID=190895 RepID=A0A2K7STB5_9VIBR|nr:MULTISPECIES: HlyU family transcriptional regulator [Vibrio]MDK9775846.1 transcriptional regulator [Vibrio sp. D401a]MDK9802923.1 transcriptional regulator [Vibrio sp. D406a]NOH47532.1 transcriptional regulator [Vibrio rotiferianus]OHY92376.1 transcriptional regulator [Vibrio rotiferianus]TMX31616.1 transcriptional regulator [Vibrio rotiferianus]